MPEADTQQRRLADEALHRISDIAKQRRVAGAGRQADTVGLQCEDVFRRGGGRHGSNVAAKAAERPHDVVLHAEVENDNPVMRPFSHRRGVDTVEGPMEGMLGRHRGDKVHGTVARRVLQPQEGLLRIFLDEGTHHHAGNPKAPCQGTSVNVRDGRNAALLEIFIERCGHEGVAGGLAALADDEGVYLDPRRLVIAIVRAVVALDRVGHRQHLAGI